MYTYIYNSITVYVCTCIYMYIYMYIVGRRLCTVHGRPGEVFLCVDGCLTFPGFLVGLASDSGAHMFFHSM